MGGYRRTHYGYEEWRRFLNGVDTPMAASLKNVMEPINDFKSTCLAVVPMIVEKEDKGIVAKKRKERPKELLDVHNTTVFFCTRQSAVFIGYSKYPYDNLPLSKSFFV